jgi:hypothetical protein
MGRWSCVISLSNTAQWWLPHSGGPLFLLKEGEMVGFEGVKVFSATMAKDRETLGEKVTQWIRENKGKEIVAREVLQSSDSEFHCLTIVIFYINERTKRGRK